MEYLGTGGTGATVVTCLPFFGEPGLSSVSSRFAQSKRDKSLEEARPLTLRFQWDTFPYT